MKKLSHYFIVFVMLFFMSINTVFAETSIGASLNLNTKELKSGQELTVTLKLENYVEIEKGVNAYKATLDYDKNIFEEVNIKNFTNLNKWEQLEYNRKTGEFVAIKKAGSKNPENVVKITLKVKNTTYYGKTNIKIKDITTSEGKKDLKIDDKTISVDIIKEQATIPSDNQGGQTNTTTSKIPTIKRQYGVVIVNKNSENNDIYNSDATNQNKEDTEKDDDEVYDYYRDNKEKESEIEKTKSTYIWAFLVIGIEIIFFIMFLIWKRQKDEDDNEEDDNNKRNKKIAMLIVTSIILMQFCGTVFAASYDFSKKGEVNGDSKIDYEDVRLIELHLIHTRDLLDEYLENGDINSDGKLTVTDLTLLVQKLEKSLDYNVILSNSNLDNYYPNKNNDITLKFIGEVDYGSTIEKVVINNKEYNIEKSKDNVNEYLVKVNAGNLAGIKEYNFTEVLLDNEKRVKVDYSIKVDVLKEIPTIENYKVSENVKESKLNISFDILDKDNSITSATLKVTDENSKVIKETTIKKGTNKIEIDVDDEKKYKANIIINYDLATNTLDKEENHTGNIYNEKELQLIINYDFKLTNIKTYKNNIENKTFESNEKIELRFDSTNITKFIPTTAKINGKNYNVEKRDNSYVVQVDKINKLGSQKIKIEEVILNNGKKFELKEKNSVSVNIIKRYPTVKDITLNENTENNNMTVKFNLENEDDAIKSAYIVLYNAEGLEIDRKELTKEELKKAGDITKTLTTKITSSYKAKLIATINQTGEAKDDQVDKVLFEQTIKASPRTKITKISIDKEYVEKKGKVTLTYDIESNKLESIAKIRVNDLDCIATKTNKNTYEVTLEVGDKSGIYNLTTTKLIYSDNVEDQVKEEVKVDILKDAPTVDNFEQIDDINNNEVTLNFDIVDNDNSFTSGKAILTDGVNTIEKELVQNKNSLKFNLENAKEYNLEIKVTYTRDSNSKVEVKDKVLTNKIIQLIADYKLVIDNIKTTNKDNIATTYYQKGDTVILSFTSTNISKFYPEYATVNGKTYKLTKNNNTYSLELKAKEKSGVETLKIESVTLNNTKKIDINKNNSVSIDVLKSTPTVEGFTYEKTEDGNLRIKFNLKDDDNSLKNATITVTDGKNTLITKELKAKENIVEVGLKTNSIEYYYAKIIANYDLDSNKNDNTNNYENKELLNKEMIISTDVIELKDVISTELYYNDEKIETLNITSGIPTNLENYYVKVNMKNLPTYYANVKEIKKDSTSNKLMVVLDQENFIMYNKDGKTYNRQNEYSFPIIYIDKDGEHRLVKKADELFKKINENPNGKFELTEDIDASSISTTTAAISQAFKGTLNGNGHKIINLPTVLFASLNGATIKDLVIENAKITNNSKAILANSISGNSTVQNTYIVNSSLSNGQNQVGAFVGNITNSTIKESSAISVNIKASNTIGGIAGQMSGGSIVENCYVTGTLEGTIYHGLGARVGGITGWDSGTKIEKCYTNVTIKAVDRTGNGGLIGGPSGGNPLVKDSVSLSSGNSSRIAGFGTVGGMKNVYEYSKSNSTTNIANNNSPIKSIDDIYDKDFYKNTLGFSEDIWNLEIVDHNTLPILKKDPLPNTVNEYEIKENKNNIPNYGEIRTNNNYQKENEILYYNLSKLMPYADTKAWLEKANLIDKKSKLMNSKIKFIVPLTETGKLIPGLRKNEVANLKKIRIVYEDRESEVVNVNYTITIDEVVAVYKIKELNIEYQFHNYLSNIDNSIIDKLTNIASALDYATNIANITSENESRLYVDYYNESVKGNIRNIIINYLMNDDDIPTYSSNKIIKKNIENKMTNELLTKILYAYNYYDKWYHMDLDGVKISDFLFYNGYLINNTMDENYLINCVINTTNRSTNNTHGFYNSYLKGKTGLSLPDFLAYLMHTINGYSDPSDWMKDHFKGILYEQPAISAIDNNIKYRVWDILTKPNNQMILPILSAPQEDMYLITVPSQLVIGSMNRYSTYLKKDGKERERMYNLVKSYAEKVGLFYGVSSTFIPNSTNILNSFVNIQFDTRFNFPASDKANAGTQAAGTTKDPVMKWVYEAVGHWGAANGSGAYANGTNVYWIVYEALGGDFNFYVYTHETAHNQDGRYFYGGKGRRNETGAESHADGNIGQQASDGAMMYNLYKNYDLATEITNNLSYERINSPEKIHSYYKEMFETGYVLEYLAGQAFLRLTPEEQAKIATQAQHPTNVSYFGTKYVRLTADDFKKMNLKTMEDLWDNHIILRGTGSSPHTWNGSYGYDSFHNLYWYKPNNDKGTADTNTFKNTGFEMLGYKGYEAGYMTYMSRKSNNDLDAIRKITGDDTMTWKKYKMSRYKTVEENLSKIKYFDYKELTDYFETALKNDAKNGNLNVSQNVRKLFYGTIKRTTNDFTLGGIYNSPKETSITSAEQLIKLVKENPVGNYRLDKDIDFSGITSENSYYIADRFIGTINGNGHKMTGMKYTLFNNVVYATIKDITIEKPDYVDNVNASIAVSSRNLILRDIRVNKSNINVPAIASKSGLTSQFGDDTITTRSTEIKTKEDFLAIGKSDVGRKKQYVLMNDIDLTGISATGNPIVSGTFSGSIDGNNHKISNAKDVLFGTVKGTIKNLKVENSAVTSGSAKGIFANTITNATLENISINNSSISNNAGQVGGLSGTISSSKINKIAITNVNIKANNTIGGLTGQLNSGTVENILITGRIQGTLWHNLGSRVGGITGWLSSGAVIKTSVTKAEIVGNGRTGNGGIIGGPNSGNSIIENSISLSTGTNSYRIAGTSSVLNGSTNVYEYSASNSATNINANNNTKVLSATTENVTNPNFYINNVKLDSKVWNTNTVKTLGYPTLK